MRLTRSQLYRWVWSTPAMHVAEMLKISGPALAKMCKRHNIPRPPRGYWRRVQVGNVVVPTPLPNPGEDVELPMVVDEELAGTLAALQALPSTESNVLLASRRQTAEVPPFQEEIPRATVNTGARAAVGSTAKGRNGAQPRCDDATAMPGGGHWFDAASKLVVGTLASLDPDGSVLSLPLKTGSLAE